MVRIFKAKALHSAHFIGIFLRDDHRDHRRMVVRGRVHHAQDLRVAHMLTGTVDCLDLLPLGRQRQIFMWKADRRLCFAVRFVHDEDRKARALRNTFAAADALLFVQARQIDNGVAYADRTEFTRTFTGVARDRLDAFDHSDRALGETFVGRDPVELLQLLPGGISVL